MAEEIDYHWQNHMQCCLLFMFGKPCAEHQNILQLCLIYKTIKDLLGRHISTKVHQNDLILLIYDSAFKDGWILLFPWQEHSLLAQPVYRQKAWGAFGFHILIINIPTYIKKVKLSSNLSKCVTAQDLGSISAAAHVSVPVNLGGRAPTVLILMLLKRKISKIPDVVVSQIYSISLYLSFSPVFPRYRAPPLTSRHPDSWIWITVPQEIQPFLSPSPYFTGCPDSLASVGMFFIFFLCVSPVLFHRPQR